MALDVARHWTHRPQGYNPELPRIVAGADVVAILQLWLHSTENEVVPTAVAALEFTVFLARSMSLDRTFSV